MAVSVISLVATNINILYCVLYKNTKTPSIKGGASYRM